MNLRNTENVLYYTIMIFERKDIVFKVVTPENCSEELLKQYVALDQGAFDPDGAITWERAQMVEKLNPGNVSFLYKGDLVVAVLSLLSIKKTAVTYAKETETPIYKILNENTLDATGEDHTLYIHNVIVDPKFQGQGLSNILLEVLKERTETISVIEEVWADAVSKGGLRFLEKAGLEPVHKFTNGTILCYEDGVGLIQSLSKLNR